MKNFVLTNLFSSFSFVFLFINLPLNWSFMFPFSWTVFSFVCVSMFCTFLIPWKNFHRMFPIFHNLGFLILVFAITKVLASLKQPSLFWETNMPIETSASTKPNVKKHPSMLTMAGFDVLLEDSLVLLTEDCLWWQWR